MKFIRKADDRRTSGYCYWTTCGGNCRKQNPSACQNKAAVSVDVGPKGKITVTVTAQRVK